MRITVEVHLDELAGDLAGGLAGALGADRNVRVRVVGDDGAELGDAGDALDLDQDGEGAVGAPAPVAVLPAPPVPIAGRCIAPTERLTAREVEVVGLVAHGLTNDEIGAAMYLAGSTVKFHLRQIAMKLRTRNRVEIAAWAWQSGVAARAADRLVPSAAVQAI
ncbi:DNA-binding CsgD family transcriptional regulator [Nocardioides zeae]|uniref:DNA-binding CsgD family transcriptional regulator n=1 Tax=Nocardioides zeae TaxID=1457234 RepID=A0ACC6IJ28_9ACTN|nr:helix-turn-helix transcriptional regulator [Nocardioides zeae]MDR6174717.1 DNA-binding CsgD family transcriptional regulator [Nocardioides zeae]MDR6210786.1 DNA-binding CsgD family transcriptional regulator [Nocardioides zeae]